MSTHVWLWLSHLQTPWYLTRVWCWWWCFWLLFTISVNILFFFPVLSLKLISAIWWCPQWWASIVLLSSRASCLVRRTPTSHRYLTANLHISYLTVTSNQEWCSTFLFFLMRHSTFHFRSLQTACHCSSWAQLCQCFHAHLVRHNINDKCSIYQRLRPCPNSTLHTNY